ncbi:MAG: hypothetical protein HUU18_04645 [Phycisphaerales bacterium]|nr:hypothetical protein [Phycisphaerales bacterium]HRJ50669.1 hypothetical protein [Phycisphaerales bacterium]
MKGVPSGVLTLYRINTSNGSWTPCGRIVDGVDPSLASITLDEQSSTAIRGISGTENEPVWLPAPRAAFARACDALAHEAVAWIWPTQQSPISDVPSLRSFLDARPNWRFLLDPVAMLTPEMLPRADDYLMRIFMAMGGRRELGAVLICDARVDDGQLVRVPLGEGCLPIDAMVAAWRASGAGHAPVGVLTPADAQRLARAGHVPERSTL